MVSVFATVNFADSKVLNLYSSGIAEKEIKQEQAARSLIEKKYSDLVGRVRPSYAGVMIGSSD